MRWFSSLPIREIINRLSAIARRTSERVGFRRKLSSLPIGARGEELAAEFLRRQGMKILYRGYRSSLGEIDLIAVDRENRRQRTIVFVEVKTWSAPAEGGPADAVDRGKQQRLTRLTLEFLKRHRLLDHRARFDVVQVILEPPSIRHFPNAFEATGEYQWYS